jgi:hypothetical protein
VSSWLAIPCMIRQPINKKYIEGSDYRSPFSRLSAQ